MKVALATIFMFSSLWLGESQAHAAVCGLRVDILKKLAEKFKEIPVASGITDNETNLLAEIFSSEKGETWTIIITNPDGRACVMMTGKNWRYNRNPVFPTNPNEKN